LRTLKNEIRQKRPLSVGLIADVQATIAEVADRGVNPDLRVEPADQLGENEGQHEYFFPAPDAPALHKVDATLLATLAADDVVRRRWIERVPKYLREARSGGRWTWLSDEELESLATQGLSPAPQP